MDRFAGNNPENEVVSRITLQNACDGISIFEINVVGKMIGIQRGVGCGDVAKHGRIIASDQVGEIRADSTAFSSNRVAFRTSHLLVEEEPFAMKPIAAGNLWNVALPGSVRAWGFERRDPRKKEAAEGQGTGP